MQLEPCAIKRFGLIKLSLILSLFIIAISSSAAFPVCNPIDPGILYPWCTGTQWGTFEAYWGCHNKVTVERVTTLYCTSGRYKGSTINTSVYTELVQDSISSIDWSVWRAVGGAEQTCPEYTDVLLWANCDTPPITITIHSYREFVCVAAISALESCCASNDSDGDGFHDDYGYDCNTGGADQAPPISDDGKNNGPDGGITCY